MKRICLPLTFIIVLSTFCRLSGQEVDTVINEDGGAKYNMVVDRHFQIGGGSGIMHYNGELDNDNALPLSRRVCGHIFFNYGITPSFTIGLALISGRVYGETRSDSSDAIFTNINFMSPILSPQLRFTYNFGGHFSGAHPGFIQPYIYSGVEMVFFDPMSDMTTYQGTAYHYWSDGTIRDLPEATENISTANHLQRNYYYETILRTADLDGLGDFKPYTFSIPFGIGFDINLNHNLSISAGASYHHTFTDHLDGISYKSGGLDPTRAIGNRRNDSYFFLQVGLTFKFYKLRKTEWVKPPAPPAYDIPEDLTVFDINNDNKIQYEEILQAINDLFDGKDGIDPKRVSKLIKFYYSINQDKQ